MPGTEAVALSCVVLSAVPKEIEAGVAQVMTGVAWPTTSETVLVAVSYTHLFLLQGTFNHQKMNLVPPILGGVALISGIALLVAVQVRK